VDPSALPAPRDDNRPYEIAMVCLGNICRSPTAEVVLTQKLAAQGLAEQVVVNSFGTGDWHLGGPMDPRAATTLTAAGYDPSRHQARQFDHAWLDRVDLVLAMDAENLRDIVLLGGSHESRVRVRLFREFDPSADEDLTLADPWFGDLDGFTAMLEVVERTTDELVRQLAERHSG
jgi:protein-tyrosine phosphatase